VKEDDVKSLLDFQDGSHIKDYHILCWPQGAGETAFVLAGTIIHGGTSGTERGRTSGGGADKAEAYNAVPIVGEVVVS
jgi:hypothetical protein